MLSLLVACAPPAGTYANYELPSSFVDTTYAIETFVPAALADTEGAPLLIVTDGDWRTDDAERVLDRGIRDGTVAPAVLVSVGYVGANERTRDFTPTAGSAGNGGGSAAFADFLAEDLLPRVEADLGVSADPDERVIFGHSFGGLFVSWLWMTRPDVAQRIVAVSPSYWWDDGVMFAVEAEAPPENLRGSIHLAAGAQENLGVVAFVDEMAARLEADGAEGLVVTTSVHPGKDHNGTVVAALTAGLAAVLPPVAR